MDYLALSLVKTSPFILQYEIQGHMLIMGKLVDFSKCGN